jgi:hypothetical protein
MMDNLDNMGLPALIDLLVVKTEKLLKAIEAREDGPSLRKLKLEVEQIQAAVKSKKNIERHKK